MRPRSARVAASSFLGIQAQSLTIFRAILFHLFGRRAAAVIYHSPKVSSCQRINISLQFRGAPQHQISLAARSSPSPQHPAKSCVSKHRHSRSRRCGGGQPQNSNTRINNALVLQQLSPLTLPSHDDSTPSTRICTCACTRCYCRAGVKFHF
jgi:hypothetical protein